MSVAERYKPKASRNRYVLTDQLVEKVLAKLRASAWALPGGDIADLIWGANGNRPLSKSAFHEAMSKLNKLIEQETGREMMSTTGYRLEDYPGEKARRRGGTD
jgi:hypothetical protein